MNFYNEHDPRAAAWLRELIKQGHIPNGVVDERDIRDIKPEELNGYTQCHFFAGIGGWSHALRLAGWSPDTPVWTGSCPCQPFSQAGHRRATDDPRHLWPAFRWLIAQCRPPTVFGEQVASKSGRAWLSGVRADLETLGYGVGGADLCAAGIGAPHLRQRLWWMAHSDHQRPQGRDEEVLSERPGQCAAGEGCSSGWLADTNSSERKACNAVSIGEGPAVARDSGAAHPSLFGRLADSYLIDDDMAGSGAGSDCRQQQPEEEVRGVNRAASGRLADTKSQRKCADQSEGDSGEGQLLAGAGQGSDSEHYGHAGAWAGFLWWPCKDGKHRKIPSEPSLFPLVDGIPGRVGILRGAGNAIVPQVAAVFIKASQQG